MSNADNKKAQPFVIMAKPVGSRCNMRCSYCYYLEKGQYSSNASQSRMSFNLLEKLIRQYIEASEGPVVSFVWHGGEPTLAGIDFYEKAVQLQKKYLPRGWQAWNNLQTNGLALNDRWCKFLKENSFDVGLSIDGAKLVHDRIRRDRGGQPTYDRIRRNAQRLQAAGIQPDLLCTVTSYSAQDPVAVYNGLRELGTGWVQFIPIVVPLGGGRFSPESVSAEEYGHFLCSVFDQWVTHDLGKMDVQLFAETARVWAGGEASLCWMAPTCGRVLIAEEDGSIYSCDHFVDNEHRIGSLASGRLDAAADCEAQIAFGNAKRDALTDQCRRCPWLKCCNGGCPKDRFDLSADEQPGQYHLCRGLEMFFAHSYEPLQSMMEMSRKGVKPQAIMEAMRQRQASRASSAGLKQRS